MTGWIREEEKTLMWKMNHETVRIQAWGEDGIRVRATKTPQINDLNYALLDMPASKSHIEVADDVATLDNGKIRAEISMNGLIRFFKETNKVLLEEYAFGPYLYPARRYKARSSDLFELQVAFKAYDDERFYGLGQHQHGFLNQKGCVIELSQRNSEVSIPFLLSSRGYGFLWNNPAIGRVELGMSNTKWIADAARQIDYFITTGNSFAEIMKKYGGCHRPFSNDS
ncbi:MAG: hypothetical protein ABSB40_09235 [Nitrososphaeria archaeon]|jgi:alpha-D-xyloside xylohydrolase